MGSFPNMDQRGRICCLLLSCDTFASHRRINRACFSSPPVATDSQQHRRPTVMTATMQRRKLLDELLSKGVRLTSQRRAVISVIQEATSHLDAGSLLELARKLEPSIDRATVYRTIELLKKLRLIDELDLMHLEGEKHYYEVKTKGEHIHLACFGCGMIEEFT